MGQLNLHQYYVATFNSWVIVFGHDAKEAMKNAEGQEATRKILQGKPIMIVRPATPDEIEMDRSHNAFLDYEKTQAQIQANTKRR